MGYSVEETETFMNGYEKAIEDILKLLVKNEI